MRSLILRRIRAYFLEAGFLEADPPIAVPWPNVDPNIYPVALTDAGGKTVKAWLHTSPELSLKKLLAAGSGNVFFLGKVFRDREGSPLHNPEFTMLEWYRVGEPPEAVMRDVEELVRSLARDVCGSETLRRGGAAIPLGGPWRRWELSEAFGSLLGALPGDAAGLRAGLRRLGLRPSEEETWEDLFFRACVDVIEPSLDGMGGVFLTGYPAVLAAMAKRREGDEGTCERFEGFLDGVELVNGYEELTDPREQEERLRQLADRHAHRTGMKLPIDPEFLSALRHGLPRCSGAALGVDRLVMLLLGKTHIADVTIR